MPQGGLVEIVPGGADSHGEHRNPGLPGRVGGVTGVPAFVRRAVGEQDNGLYAVGRPSLQHLNGTVQSLPDGRAVGGLKAPQSSQAQVPVFGKGDVQTDEVVEGHQGGGVTRLDLLQEGPGRRLGGPDPGGMVVAVLHAAGTVQDQDRFQRPAGQTFAHFQWQIARPAAAAGHGYRDRHFVKYRGHGSGADLMLQRQTGSSVLGACPHRTGHHQEHEDGGQDEPHQAPAAGKPYRVRPVAPLAPATHGPTSQKRPPPGSRKDYS